MHVLRSTLLTAFLGLTLWSQAGAQTETVLYDGWANDYAAGSNRTVFAPGIERPGSAGVDPYYRFIDGDAVAADVQHFSATAGIDGVPTQYIGPTLYGGATYRDNVRPDDVATFGGTVLAVRSNAFDVDDGSGLKGDPLRAYIPGDNSGLTFDEAFGALLFDFSGGAGLTGLSWTGATNDDALSATVRWIVLDGGTLYVSDASFTVANNGSTTQTNALPDVTATNWAAWAPESDIADLKFSATGPTFGTVAFTDVTKVGYLWELSDSSTGTLYLDMARFTASKETVAPVITSAATASGNVGVAFAYQIEATDNPTSFGLTGTLPDGLTLDTATGEISGTPTAEEVQTVTLEATNAEGTGTAPLEITVGPELDLPEITNPPTATASAGGDFDFQIEANNAPTGYSASGLPAGLSVDPATGRITGTAMEAGAYSVVLTASNEAGSSQDFAFTLTVAPFERSELPGGRDFHVYFLGNSLTLSLTTAPQPELARLERLFAARGDRLVFGATLGAGVNLDQHWTGKLYSDPASPNWMKQTYFDDEHEHSINNGWAGPGADFGTTRFRDYNFALQGQQRLYDGTVAGGHTFDALVLQPYVAYLEPESYTPTEATNGAVGDRAAVNYFIDYASGNNPSSHTAVKRFYIYSAWPQLLGIEQAAIDTDGNGVFSFSEFYASPYAPPINPANSVNPRTHVPKRDYITQLHDAARADNPALADRIFLIPVGEVFAELDRLIRLGQLSGIEAYHTGNFDYYVDARAGETITFNFIYPPNEPGSWGNTFIAAQGIKNFYADNIHWNDQTHNDPDSGTLGAYVAAATIQAVLSGDPPARLAPAEVAAYYEGFDPDRDAALIQQIQQVIWTVVTSDNWQGVDYADRTGLGTLPATATSYRDFKATHFTAAEQSDPAVSGEGADPDGDGDANLLELFRRGDPKVADSEGTVDLTLSGGTATIQFEGLRRASGLEARVETSPDLSQWSRVDRNALTVRASATSGFDHYQLQLPAPADREFYRVALPYVPDRPTLPLVAWGDSADMVASIQNLPAGKGSQSIDFSTPSNPSVGAGYDTFSPVFYAAFAALTDNDAEILRLNDNNNPGDGTGDTLLLKLTQATQSNDGVFTALWRQQGDGSQGGFLNGADTGDVTLANMETTVKVGFGFGSTSELRFVIEKDGAYYISESRGAITSVYKATAPGNDSPFERVALSNPHGVRWYAYDPAADIQAIGSEVVLPDFSGVTAVGLNWRTSGDEALRNLYIESFQANFYP